MAVRFWWFFFLAFAFTLSTVAQDRPSPIQISTRPIQAFVDLVLVRVGVTDLMHRPVMDLSEKDFALFEDNEQQPIKYFYEEDPPISVAMVLDMSGSMKTRVDLLRDSIDQFFENANPRDEYYVVTVGSKPELLAGPARSSEEIQNKLLGARPTGWTALMDSIALAALELKHARHERKVLLIFSDGGENSSRYTEREVRNLVEESDLDAYAIGIFDDPLPFFRPLERKLGMAVLNRITNVTGGRAVPVNRVTRIPEVAAALSRELRHQYVLGYQPQKDSEGRFRKIKVELNSGEKAKVLRTYYRKNYWRGNN